MGLLSRRLRITVVGFLWIALAAIFFGGAYLSHASAEFNYAIGLDYQLQTDGSARVVTAYHVTNQTTNRILASIKINTPVKDASEVVATFADGTQLPVTMAQRTNSSQGYSYDYQELTVVFGRWPTGRGVSQDFTVSYKTSELVDVKGSSKTFSVPSLSDVQSQENYRVTVSVPQDYGKLYSTGALPDIDSSESGRLRYAFSNSADLKRSISLIFGDTTVYKIDFAYPLKNNTSRDQTFVVTLPPDTSSQKIYINKLDPAPLSTRLDADGNVLAEYRVPARTTKTVHTDIAAQVHYLEYDLSKGGNKSDIPADISKNYTGSTQYWQTSDATLIAKARQAVVGQTKVVDMVRSIYELTKSTLTYNNEKIKYNIRQGSSKALNNPNNAVCLEYSDVMIALLRSQGIPARMPVGYAYAGSLKQSKAVSDSLHSWVEAYVPGVGWINVDPTWGEKYDNFGKSDLDHVAFALWGRNDSLPAAVMANGEDQNYQYEDTKVTYVEDVPRSIPEGKIRAHKYVLFPGISLVQYEATAPEQVAGDEYAMTITQGARRSIDSLGSLAPAQNISRSQLFLGRDFNQPVNLIFSQQEAGERLVLASTKIPVTYWPMAVSFTILAGALLLIALKLIIRNKRAIEQAETQRAQEVIKTQALTRVMKQESRVMKSTKEVAAELRDESKLSQ